jgi:hypothetical protein
MPKASISHTSNIAPWTLKAPMAQATMISGATMEKGMRRMAANSGTVESTTSSPAMLPRYMLAMRPHTNCGCSMKRSGPGWSPHTMSPPRSTAAVAEPGMPRASIGRSALVPAAHRRLGRSTSCPLAEPFRVAGELCQPVTHEGCPTAPRGDSQPQPPSCGACPVGASPVPDYLMIEFAFFP